MSLNRFVKNWLKKLFIDSTYRNIFLLGIVLHLCLIFYGFSENWAMLNTVPDTGAVVTALELFSAAKESGFAFWQEYITSHTYPLGYSLLILPVTVASWLIHFLVGSWESFDVARFDGLGLAFFSARLVNLVLFAIGAVYLQKIIKFLDIKEKIAKLGFALYIFSPLALVFSFQERPHLPAALLMIPALYFSLKALHNKDTKNLIWAGVLTGLVGSIIQYGFIVFVGLFFAILFLKDTDRNRKIKLLLTVTLSCLASAFIFGYPGLLVNPGAALLNDVHRPYVAFDGSGFPRIFHTLWIYEPLVLLFLVFGLYKYGKKIKDNLSLSLLIFLPSLIFFIVFGLYSNFQPRQIGGMFTLLIIGVLFLWKDDISEKVYKSAVYLSGAAAVAITLSGLLMKPSFELAYDYLKNQVPNNEESVVRVVDNIHITTYLDPISEALTGHYVNGNDIPERLNAYRRFPFALISLRGRADLLQVAEDSESDYLIVDTELSSDKFESVFESPYRSVDRRLIPFHVKFPGRQKAQIYKKL